MGGRRVFIQKGKEMRDNKESMRSKFIRYTLEKAKEYISNVFLKYTYQNMSTF